MSYYALTVIPCRRRRLTLVFCSAANVIPSVSTAPPPPEPRRTMPSGACRHDGRVYLDSAVFRSDSTALKPTRTNQCALCVCDTGSVRCQLKTCPRLKCATTRRKKNDCCRQCSSPPEKKRPGVCRSGDERHKNGSTWHPVVHPFGRVRCVVCHCLNGRISCDRVQCSPGTRPACDGKTGNDQCCKRCRKQTKRPDLSAESSNRDNGSESSALKLCVPRSSDIIVSRYAARRQLTLIFANTRRRRADVLSWEVHRGRVTKFSEQSLPTADIDALFGSSHNRRFKVIGTARSKKVARFRRKVERFRRRCQKSGKCRKKVLLRQIERLKLRRAKIKPGKHVTTQQFVSDSSETRCVADTFAGGHTCHDPTHVGDRLMHALLVALAGTSVAAQRN
ncbi:hypothetical protein LSAT2_026866 [Lamellibrachia satsuma]|nr:hypothetical protein LSAT2_026866 [Lamellibrachia satsuma]